ncbi:hypothetical protein Tco_0152169 [Tanacetum coccineum]
MDVGICLKWAKWYFHLDSETLWAVGPTFLENRFEMLSVGENLIPLSVGNKRLLSAVEVTAAGYDFYCW